MSDEKRKSGRTRIRNIGAVLLVLAGLVLSHFLTQWIAPPPDMILGKIYSGAEGNQFYAQSQRNFWVSWIVFLCVMSFCAVAVGAMFRKKPPTHRDA